MLSRNIGFDHLTGGVVAFGGRDLEGILVLKGSWEGAAPRISVYFCVPAQASLLAVSLKQIIKAMATTRA